MSTRTLRPLSAVVLATIVVLVVAACGAPAAPAPTTAPSKPAAAPTKAPAAAPTSAPAAAPTAAAAAKPATTFPKIQLKMGYTHNTEMSPHKGSVKMAELIKERTGGNVTIQIFPNSQLGNEKDMIEQVKNGILDLDNVSVGMLSNFDGWGPLGVLSMPYLFKGNTEEAQLPAFLKETRGPTFKELADKAAKQSGIRSLDMGWWYGLRQTTTKNKPIEHPSDLKGMKIRTPDAPVQELAMKALGASVTPMGFAELYSALQMGVVDGQENPINTIYTSKFYEVQKYVSLTGHMTQNQVVIINDKKFQSFSPELQDIFIKAAIEAGDYQNQMQIAANKQNLQDLKDKGMTVVTPNLAEFADATKDAWKEFEPVFGKGWYEKVKAEVSQ